MELVTVIVGIYNGEKYLEQCLESVVKQTYSNLEILLIDDGSTDNSGKIADEFAKKDQRFKVIHKSNQGVSASRNLGLSIMQGEYVCIIDQDDYLHKDYIKYFMSMIKEYNVDIATGVYVSDFIGEPPEDKEVVKSKCEIWSGDKAAKEILLHNIQVAPWNKIIRKKLLDDNGIRFQEQFFCGEGLAFSVESYQSADRVAVTHEKLYYYRIDNATSGTSTFSETKLKSALGATDYIWEKLKDKSKYSQNIIKFEKWRTTVGWFVTLRLCGEKRKYPKIYKELKKGSRKNALKVLSLPVRRKQKLIASVFFLSPTIGSYILSKHKNKKTGGKFSK